MMICISAIKIFLACPTVSHTFALEIFALLDIVFLSELEALCHIQNGRSSNKNGHLI